MPVGDAPCLPRGGGEHEAVGFPDPARRDGRARLRELVAGGQHGDPWPRADRDGRAARRGEQPELHGPNLRPSGENLVTRVQILSGAPDGVPRLCGLAHLYLGRTAVRPLDRYHGVGARGKLRASHYPDGRAMDHRVRSGVAGHDLAHHGERHGIARPRVRDVGGMDRVSIHRRVVEGRQRMGSGDVLGEHAALGFEQAEFDRRDRPDRGKDRG